MFSITQKLFSFGIFLFLLLSVTSAIDINTCWDLTTAGDYALTADINVSLIGNSACFNVSGSNIFLDLQNHRIDGTGPTFPAAGIFNVDTGDGVTYVNNITITNGEVRYSGFDTPMIYLVRTENSTFTNLTLANATMVSNAIIQVTFSSANNFSNMTVANSSMYGIRLQSSSVNNSFDNVTVKENGDDGFYLDAGCTYNNITNSIAYNNSGHGIYLNAGYLNLVNITLSYNSVSNQKAGLRFTDLVTYSNMTNITANYNYIGISSFQSGMNTLSNTNLSLINVTNNTYGVFISIISGANIMKDSIFDFAIVANNTEGGIFLDLSTASGASSNITLKGGEIWGNGGNGINVLANAGVTPLSHLQIKNMVLYNNTGMNVNITGTYNTTISNITSYYLGIMPADWISVWLNRTTGASVSALTFSSNNTGFTYYNVSSSNFNATNCLFDSGTKDANVSLYTNWGNYTAVAWDTPPATVPYGNDLGYYVNITNQSAETSLNITFHYTDADVALYDVSQTKMYKYSNGVWTDLSTLTGVTVTATPTANLITAENVSSFSIFGIFAPNYATTTQTTTTSDYQVKKMSAKGTSVSQSFSYEAGRLTVYVESEDGKPINGVIVSLRDLSNTKLLSSSTNTEGFATMDVGGMPDGTYYITLYKGGYTTDGQYTFLKSSTKSLTISTEVECTSNAILVTVTDAAGNPVQDAFVYFSEIDKKTTDMTGKARLLDMLGQSFEQGKSYHIMISKEGYSQTAVDMIYSQCSKKLDVVGEVECTSGAILVTVKDNLGKPLQDAQVYFSEIDKKATDQDGKARLFDMLGQSFESGKSYFVMAKKEGYDPGSVSVPYIDCNQGTLVVKITKDCPSGTNVLVEDSIKGPINRANITIDGVTRTTGFDGVLFIPAYPERGHHSIFVKDSRYAQGGTYETSEDLSCKPKPIVPGKQIPVGSECDYDEECDVTQSCADGSCVLLTGECGHAENHKWVVDACCNEYIISAPEKAYVGDTATVTVTRCDKPVSEAQVKITNPRNDVKTISTDMAGKTLLPVDFAGTYKVDVLKQGTQIGSKLIQGDPKEVVIDQSRTRGVLGGEPTTDNLLLIAIIVVVILGVFYLRGHGKKRSYSKQK